AGAVAQAAEAMERPLAPRAVVAAELPDARHDVRDVLGRDLAVGEVLLASDEARLRPAPEIHDDLEQPLRPLEAAHALLEIRRERPQESAEVVRHLSFERHLTTTGARAGSSMRTASSLTKSIAVALSLNPSLKRPRATCSSYERTGAASVRSSGRPRATARARSRARSTSPSAVRTLSTLGCRSMPRKPIAIERI